MPTIYRIGRPEHDPFTDVGSVDAIEGVARSGSHGCYDVDEISSGPIPSGHTSRRWGTAIKRPDGQCTLDPDPRPHR